MLARIADTQRNEEDKFLVQRIDHAKQHQGTGAALTPNLRGSRKHDATSETPDDLKQSRAHIKTTKEEGPSMIEEGTGEDMLFSNHEHDPTARFFAAQYLTAFLHDPASEN